MTDGALPARPPQRPEYAEAAAWAAEVHGTLRASRRTAWLAASGATLAAVLLGAALATIGPLRSAVPYTVVVDRQSGHANAVRRLAPGPLTSDLAVTDAFLARYVAARESFDAGQLQANYRLVSLWSDPRVRSGYDAAITRANPASPLALYTPATNLSVTVKSISRLSPTQALVRFDTVRQDTGVATGEQRGWQATLTYSVSDAPMINAERFDNPLGFRVTEYRRDPDGSLPRQVVLTP
jgi:type IV secretion system protein VirB8